MRTREQIRVIHEKDMEVAKIMSAFRYRRHEYIKDELCDMLTTYTLRQVQIDRPGAEIGSVVARLMRLVALLSREHGLIATREE